MTIGRPRKTEARVGLNTKLPAATAVKMELYLNSMAAGGKVPLGAKQEFISRLINKFFEHRDGVEESLPRTQLEQIYDRVTAIRDLAGHQRAGKEALPAIHQLAKEAAALLVKKKEEVK